LTVAVSFQFLFVENGVKQFALPFGKEKIRWLRQASLFVRSSSPRLVNPQRTGPEAPKKAVAAKARLDAYAHGFRSKRLEP
jgi:hypothetical protein